MEKRWIDESKKGFPKLDHHHTSNGNKWSKLCPALHVIMIEIIMGGGGEMIKKIPWGDIVYGVGIALFVLFLFKR